MTKIPISSKVVLFMRSDVFFIKSMNDLVLSIRDQVIYYHKLRTLKTQK